VGEDDENGKAAQIPSARDLERVGAGPLLRLLAPLLVGNGTGIEARLPYDLEIR